MSITTLYEMLDVTLYYQTVCVYEINAYDQNMPLFKGTIDEARTDDNVWIFLMNEIDQYYICDPKALVIKVKSKHYNDRFEEHYSFSEKWGKDISQRPWRYSIEIDSEVKTYFEERWG